MLLAQCWLLTTNHATGRPSSFHKWDPVRSSKGGRGHFSKGWRCYWFLIAPFVTISAVRNLRIHSIRMCSYMNVIWPFVLEGGVWRRGTPNSASARTNHYKLQRGSFLERLVKLLQGLSICSEICLVAAAAPARLCWLSSSYLCSATLQPLGHFLRISSFGEPLMGRE